MSKITAMEIAASGMDAHRLVLDTIAANIANSNTTRTATGGPYRPLVVTLAEKLDFNTALQGSEYQLGGVEVVEIRELDVEPKKVFDPSHPDADDLGYVHYPDIDPVSQMVTLLKSKRAYEANVKVINAAKSMALRALEIGK
jgi:flagellar basal-body rod protein FlgC